MFVATSPSLIRRILGEICCPHFCGNSDPQTTRASQPPTLSSSSHRHHPLICPLFLSLFSDVDGDSPGGKNLFELNGVDVAAGHSIDPSAAATGMEIGTFYPSEFKYAIAGSANNVGRCVTSRISFWCTSFCCGCNRSRSLYQSALYTTPCVSASRSLWPDSSLEQR